MTDDLLAALTALPGAEKNVEPRGDGLWLDAPDLDVVALAGLMRRLGARLSTMTGVPLSAGETAVLYHYVVGTQPLNVRVRTRGNSLPSITPITRAAGWIEREIHDLYGVHFLEHPNLARLIRPPSFEPGMFREDAS